MASRRMISSDIFEDEFFCDLSHVERLLWIGIITQCADDQGRLQDRPKMINSRVFPNDELPVSDIEKGIEEFYKSGKIVRYERGGKKLIQIIKWWVYQTPAWASPSKYLPPENWTDRVKYHAVGNKVISENWDCVGGYIEGYVPTVHIPLHSAIEDVNVNGDVNGDGEAEYETLPPLPNAYTIYEANIGQSTPFIADGIDNWLKTYPAEWIPAAIEEAVKNSARNFKYCDAILKRWAVDGFKSEKRPQSKPSNIEANFALANDLLREQNVNT